MVPIKIGAEDIPEQEQLARVRNAVKAGSSRAEMGWAEEPRRAKRRQMMGEDDAVMENAEGWGRNMASGIGRGGGGTGIEIEVCAWTMITLGTTFTSKPDHCDFAGGESRMSERKQQRRH